MIRACRGERHPGHYHNKRHLDNTGGNAVIIRVFGASFLSYIGFQLCEFYWLKMITR